LTGRSSCRAGHGLSAHLMVEMVSDALSHPARAHVEAGAPMDASSSAATTASHAKLTWEQPR
jgi:hypothetical protein